MLLIICMLLSLMLLIGVASVVGVGYLVYDNVRRWRNGGN